MNREEFLALPPSVQAKVLFDVLATDLAAVDPPVVVRSPKYDYKVYGNGGFTWASEMLLEDLQWHLKRARESAASGSQWAQKDAKKAEALSRWVSYRESDSHSCAVVTRGEVDVLAESPKKFPRKHDTSPARDFSAFDVTSREPWDE